MEKEFEEKLVEYLKKNGINDIPTTNKEILKTLKNIVYNERVNIDCADLRHNSNVKSGIDDIGYIDNVQNLEINVQNGLYYIANVGAVVREERKLERIAKFKKILKIK